MRTSWALGMRIGGPAPGLRTGSVVPGATERSSGKHVSPGHGWLSHEPRDATGHAGRSIFHSHHYRYLQVKDG